MPAPSRLCSLKHLVILLVPLYFLVKTYLNHAVGVIRAVPKLPVQQAPSKSSSQGPTDLQTRGSKVPNQSQNKVLFVTEYRSGSTFLSTILNKNRQVFYLFEPLYLTNTNITQQQEILLDLFYRCQVPLTEKYMEPELLAKFTDPAKQSDLTKTDLRSINHYCLTEGVCFRHKTDTFKRPPFCPQPHMEEGLTGDRLQKLCPNFKDEALELAKPVCQSSKTIAAKVIRVWRLTSLPDRIKSDPDFKILYLIRDPRGIANSRFHTSDENWTSDNTKKLRNICSNFNHFIKDREDFESESSTKFQIKAIRYEDFAMQPRPLTEQLNSFLGLDSDQEVFETLDRITHDDKSVLDKSMQDKMTKESALSTLDPDSSDQSNENSIHDGTSEVLFQGDRSLAYSDSEAGEESSSFIDSPIDPRLLPGSDTGSPVDDKVDKPCTFCVVRDTRSNLFHWRKSLNWEQVEVIQESCSEMMEHFGYKQFTREEYESERFSDDFLPVEEECPDCDFSVKSMR